MLKLKLKNTKADIFKADRDTKIQVESGKCKIRDRNNNADTHRNPKGNGADSSSGWN